MKHSLRAWLFFLLVGAGFTSFAAERENEDEQETRQEEKDEPVEKQAGKPGQGEIFIPSEEISEDFAVSFPVDI